MPNITLLITGVDSQSSLLPASKPTRGGQETGEDWPLLTEVALGHLADMGVMSWCTQQRDRGHSGASVRGQG